MDSKITGHDIGSAAGIPGDARDILVARIMLLDILTARRYDIAVTHSVQFHKCIQHLVRKHENHIGMESCDLCWC